MDGSDGSSRAFKRRKRDDGSPRLANQKSSTSKRGPVVVDLTKDDASVREEHSVIVIDATSETTTSSTKSTLNKYTSHEVITLLDTPEIIIPITPPKAKRAAPPLPPPEPASNALKCPICLETFSEAKKRGSKVIVTKCGHIFCDPCVKKALAHNDRKCPKCRKAIPARSPGFIEIFDIC